MTQFTAKYEGATIEVIHVDEGHVYSYYLPDLGLAGIRSTKPNAAHGPDYFEKEALEFARKFIHDNPPKLD